MRRHLAVAVFCATLFAVPASRASAVPSVSDTSADLSVGFAVSSNTQIPGKTLKPGSYTIRILDHLSDRVVMRVEDSHGKSEGIFLGVPNTSFAGRSSSGPIAWEQGSHNTQVLRGFAFPGGAIEFVYAKEEAVPIAKANSAKVLAIDPASEGRPSAGNLNDEDRRMVTLWTLAPTRIGPNDSQKAVEAQRYNPPASDAAQVARQAPVQPAEAAPVASASATSMPAPSVGRTAPRKAPLQQIASAKRPAGITALPHTGSELPLAALGSVLLLMAAAAVRRLRALRA